MEGRFEFDGAEVIALVEESQAAKTRVMTEAQRYLAAGVDLTAPDAEWTDDVDHPGTGAPPGLWLMNDRGVYLRSNAQQRPAESVAYAHGFRAELQVGDETTCEFIDAAPLAQLQPGDTLVLTVNDAKIRISLIRNA
jgi:hypothetical protein